MSVTDRSSTALQLMVVLFLLSACKAAPADQATQLPGALPPLVRVTGVVPPPPAEFVAFADTLHGVVVPDPLRWLEDTLAENTRAWVRSQSAYTDCVLARRFHRRRDRTRLRRHADDWNGRAHANTHIPDALSGRSAIDDGCRLGAARRT